MILGDVGWEASKNDYIGPSRTQPAGGQKKYPRIDWPDDIVGSTICGELDQCSGSNASKASPALLSVHAAMPALMRTMSPLVEQAVLRSALLLGGQKLSSLSKKLEQEMWEGIIPANIQLFS